jgi:hypothetical protein
MVESARNHTLRGKGQQTSRHLGLTADDSRATKKFPTGQIGAKGYYVFCKASMEHVYANLDFL